MWYKQQPLRSLIREGEKQPRGLTSGLLFSCEKSLVKIMSIFCRCKREKGRILSIMQLIMDKMSKYV